MSNEVKGYSTFNDIEDAELRTYNRARIMKNIMLDYSKDKIVSPKGILLLTSYMESIPQPERMAAYNKLTELLQQKEVE